MSMSLSRSPWRRSHPDKLCDGIADAVVDALLHQDPRATAEVECAVASGVILLPTHVAVEPAPALGAGGPGERVARLMLQG